MSIGIYKIENKNNNQCYIGQSIDIERRWKTHLQPCIYANPFSESYNYKLYVAFRKYGVESFIFSIIELCEREQLNEREQYWIKHYDSYNTGYNMTIGGEGAIKESIIPVYCYSIYGEFLKEYKNVKEAAQKLNLKPQNIYGALSRGHNAGGYQWSYSKYDRIETNFNTIPVIAFSLSGKRIKLYNSINEAIKETGDSYQSIKKSCDTKHHSGKTYQWRYWFEDPNLQEILPYKYDNKKAIDQYDLEGNFITTFNSMFEAGQWLNLSGSNLTTCCKNKQKSYGGYLWCYHNDPAPLPYIDLKYNHNTSSGKRQVLQYSKDMKFLNSYESAHEAARQINNPKCANHITECCQGKRKTCNNYIWKYGD